jgi:hypothetical protein
MRRWFGRSPGMRIGLLLGVAATAWLSWQWHAVPADGRRSAGLGTSIGLFIVCLPWSGAVWGAVAVIAEVAVGVTGHEPPLGIAPFLAMPIAAGAGWGWVADVIRVRFGRSAGAEPPIS